MFRRFILGPTAEWIVATINSSDITSKGDQADWQVVSVHLKNGSRTVNYRITISIPPKKYFINHDDP